MIIVGIDLGTSNCCISYIENGIINLINDDKYPDKFFIPSIINIEKEGILIGNEIDKLHINKNRNIFHNFKRLVGHKITDIKTTNLIKILDYDIIEENEMIILCTQDKTKYYLEEIFVYLLQKIKKMIINKLGNDNWKCIVTIPAYFNQNQKQLIWNSIQIVNLPCIKLLNEPTAAFFAYAYYNKILYEEEIKKKILVIDFGAGTLDLTIIEIIKDDELLCEVLGIYGNNNFGGIDITNAIYISLFGMDKEKGNDINIKLRIAEEIKILLSNQLDVSYYSNDLDETIKFTYKKYIEILKELENNIIDTIENILKITELNKEEIDEVILVGGTFKIQYFRDLVNEYFKKIKINQISLKIDKQNFLLYEDIAVSIGASVYGYYNEISSDLVLIERLPLSIGIETINNQIIKIIDKNTIIPITKTKIFTTEEDNQSNVDINIYQGESSFKENNILIGTLTLSNIPKGNRPVILITIKIDTNNIINITAKDKKCFVENNMIIENNNKTLTNEIINDLIKKYENDSNNEKQYKKLIDNFYNIITNLDKISYQLNFNFILNLEDKIKYLIIKDIENIINIINNNYIFSKYNLNKEIINKIVVINSITIDEIDKELNEEEIEEYLDNLIKIRSLINSKYELFLIQPENNISCNNEFDDLNNYENINNNYETSIKDLEKDNELINNELINNEFINDNKLVNNDNELINDNEFDDLIIYIKNEYKNFNLTNEGEQKLLEYIKKEHININDVNMFCNFIQQNFSN